MYLYRAIEDTMLDLATEVPHGRVLDVACGTGKQAMRIAERGCLAVGAEASMEMIGVGRWVQPQSQARMVRSIAETLPFPDGALRPRHVPGLARPLRRPPRIHARGRARHEAMMDVSSSPSRTSRASHAGSAAPSTPCKRRLGRNRPAWRLYWQIPEDHNFKGDLPYVRGLGGGALELE